MTLAISTVSLLNEFTGDASEETAAFKTEVSYTSHIVTYTLKLNLMDS